jgi:SAM-dependent methyltransferase
MAVGAIRRRLRRLTDVKSRGELRYWRRRAELEGGLTGPLYERLFTTHFGLGRDSYRGKRVLDVGCGPRGSLEWATMAAERVGLDPLADAYRALGTGEHGMTYVSGAAEAMPFPDGRFDVVSSFNSLDHVDDVDATLQEIARVLRPGGQFLLLTELNHDPTPAEPQAFSWELLNRVPSELSLAERRDFERTGPGIYAGIARGRPYDHADPSKRTGILSARFRRTNG